MANELPQGKTIIYYKTQTGTWEWPRKKEDEFYTYFYKHFGAGEHFFVCLPNLTEKEKTNAVAEFLKVDPSTIFIISKKAYYNLVMRKLRESNITIAGRRLNENSPEIQGLPFSQVRRMVGL
jgi:hypothetical protein